MKRPHVVLICVDQWRGDALSIDGHPTVRTPYLDGLADRGARAASAYSCTPSCIPARMALMTGLSPEHHGRVGYRDGVPFDIETTLPGEFTRAGYQTHAIGKMHYTPERHRIGFDSLELHDGYLHHSRTRDRDPAWYDDYLVWLRAQPGSDAVADYIDDGLNCNSVVARPWPGAERLHPTNWVVTSAVSWLYRRDPTVPFFLYLSFHRPHPPYDPPAWAFEQYLAAPPVSPPVGDWVDILDDLRNDARPDAQVAVYPDDVQHRARAGYYGHMGHIDQQIQRFLEILQEFGLRDDTVICFTSDHGEMLGDHHMWRKGYPYEGSTRVPFVLTGPGIPARGRFDGLVELRDVMPTLLDCAGLDIPDGLDGESVLPLLRDADAAWRDHLHGEHVMWGQSLQWIRAGDLKYVWWSGTGREQLFDLADDPDELRDLYESSDRADDLARCQALLVDHLRGREEGFVSGDALVPGREVSDVLSGAGQRRR